MRRVLSVLEMLFVGVVGAWLVYSVARPGRMSLFLRLPSLLNVPSLLGLIQGELTRPSQMQLQARSLGLTFAAFDRAYVDQPALLSPFDFFLRRTEEACTNVMTGDVEGISVLAFDLIDVGAVQSSNLLEVADGLGAKTASPVRYSCVIAPLGTQWPHVVIEPASTPIGKRQGGEAVGLEWGQFNDRYRVTSADRAVVPMLLDVELMAWLVDTAPPQLTWEVQDNRVLCRAPSVEPRVVADLVRVVTAFVRRIDQSRAAGS